MPLLNLDDQIYPNASTVFAVDPQLRALLQNTAAAAAATGTPVYGASAPAIPLPGGGMAGPPPTPGTQRPELTPTQAQSAVQKTTPRSDLMAPTPGGPAMASTFLGRLAPSDTPPSTFSGAVAPPAVPGSGLRVPAPGTTTANTAAYQGPSKLAAFLQGLSSSDAVLPAIGGGLAAVEGIDRAKAIQNQTVRALVNRGLDAETAAAAVANPTILKSVLSSLFPAAGAAKIQEIYSPDTGQPMKVIMGAGGQYTPVGGMRQTPATNQLSVAQGKANIKRVQAMQEDAKDADAQLGYLSQLKAARDTVSYEGYPGASWIAKAAGILGYGGGQTVQSLALNIQLGFTARTKGAISDREMAMFAGATPGLAIADPGANDIIAGMAASFQRVKERAKFYEAYMATHNGSLEGAQDVWDAYVIQNPILTQRVDGSFAVKRENIGNWKDYVGMDAASAYSALRERPAAGVTGPISSAYNSRGVSSAPPQAVQQKPRLVQRNGKTYKQDANGQWQEWVP